MARRVTADQFVGRRDVLALFDDVLDSSDAGSGNVVLIAGEAGVGKSRAVGELIARARGRDALVVFGRCVEHGEEVMPLAPITDLIRDIVSQTSPDELREIFGPDVDVLTRQLPAALSTGPIDVEGAMPSLGALFDGLLVALCSLSDRRSVIVVVEDLHWSDESTRRLLAFVAPRLIDHAVVLVMTYRSDDLHRRHPLRPFLAALQRATRPERLEIAPFTPTELAEFVEDVTRVKPDERFVTAMYDRCGGNAFFAEELLAGDQRNVSSALREVILAQIDHLNDVEACVLRAGAAAGSGVSPVVLSAACDLDIRLVLAAIEVLVDAAIWIYDGNVVRFRHELAREVIDAELLGGERAAVHGELARARTALTPDRKGEIARHWMLAGDQRQAFEASIAAGRAAAKAGAAAEALPQFERALELWDRIPEAPTFAACSHGQFLLDAADVAGRSGSFARATALGQRALRLFPCDPVAEGLACLRLVDWAWWNEREDDAAKLIERAITLIPAEPPSEARALAVAWQALILSEETSTSLSELPAEALTLARSSGAKRAEAHALITIGSGQCVDGTTDGLDKIREGLEIARSHGYSLEAGRAYHNLTVYLELFSRHSEVIALEQEALDFCAAAGIYRVYGIMVERSVIRSLQRLGRWSAAEARADRLLAEFGNLRLEHFSLADSWGLILVRQGRLHGLAPVVSDALDQIPIHPFIFGAAATTAVELAAAEGQILDVPELVDSTLHCLLPRGQRDAAELVASAIGIIADWSFQLTARSRVNAAEVEMHHYESWIERVDQASTSIVAQGTQPDLAPRLAHARAELARLRAEPCAKLWADLVAAWDELDAAYEGVYSRLRLANALLKEEGARTADARSAAREHLRAARISAIAMGAVPLTHEIDALDRRAHLNLGITQHSGDQQPAALVDADQGLGLTQREREVMHLVAAGHTNGQIGKALYISRKTASVHVSNILRKLGVSNRIEAAAIVTNETRYAAAPAAMP